MAEEREDEKRKEAVQMDTIEKKPEEIMDFTEIKKWMFKKNK